MVDLWGPGAFGAEQAASSRPSYAPTNGGGDPETWYQDCSSPASDDGTEWRSAALNIILAQMRSVARKSGVPVSNLDDHLLARAIRSQGLNYIAIVGGTANALTAALDPVLSSHVPGAPFRVKIATTNTGAVTLDLGPGALPVVYPGGGAIKAGDFAPGLIVSLIDDTTRYICVGGATTGDRLINIQRFTSSGAYTPSTGVRKILVKAIGGGGAGGGGFATTGSSLSTGSGGGSGAYGEKVISSGITSTAVTIGAAGVGSSGAAGGNGGTTSFGALLSCPGGGGGPTATTAASSSVISGQGPPAAAPTGADLGWGGQPGLNGYCFANFGPVSGQGAVSTLGAGGTNTSGGVGGAGRGYGSGGAGNANGISQGNTIGPDGAPGYLEVWEYA